MKAEDVLNAMISELAKTQLYTVEEAADKLHMSSKSVERLIADGRLGSYKPERGRTRLIGQKHIEAFLSVCEVAPIY